MNFMLIILIKLHKSSTKDLATTWPTTVKNSLLFVFCLCLLVVRIVCNHLTTTNNCNLFPNSVMVTIATLYLMTTVIYNLQL